MGFELWSFCLVNDLLRCPNLLDKFVFLVLLTRILELWSCGADHKINCEALAPLIFNF